MEYYLLSVEEQEAAAIEEALRWVNYDVDDRAFNWGKEETDKIINSMTKENATKIILQLLPEPVGDKFSELLGLQH